VNKIFKSQIVKLALINLVIITLIVSIFINPFKSQTEDLNAISLDGSYIKWVDFNVPYAVMEKALYLDVNSYNKTVRLNWIEIMAYLSAKCGGNYKNNKSKDLDALVANLNGGETIENLTVDLKYYNYYYEAYYAIFSSFVGEYEIQEKSTLEDGLDWQQKYGLKVFSPIAKGYGFNHYDDFGNQRSFGFARKHLGNDLLGNVGTPIVAIESGTVEVMAWNIYGGWRIGIRSFDKKRYYYYAHLRKDKPFQQDLYQGKVVKAGDVIGYLGMTGYSTKENVNNIKIPHLHFGMQLIFDESQKEGNNEIWIDVYSIINLLQKNKSAVVKSSASNEFHRVYDYLDKSNPS